jgi:hypothetical protein
MLAWTVAISAAPAILISKAVHNVKLLAVTNALAELRSVNIQKTLPQI